MGCQWEDIPRSAHKGNRGQFLELSGHRYHPWRSVSFYYVTVRGPSFGCWVWCVGGLAPQVLWGAPGNQP